MSLLTNQSQINPTRSFFAASGSGGGGGGGNTLTLSTLTFGIGTGSNNNNIFTQTNQLVLSGVGDPNTFNIGYSGSNQDVGNQYSVEMVFASGAGGDITFGDINGSSSALTAINYQQSGLAGGNISTFIYGSTEIKPDGTGGGSRLYVSSLNCSSINGAAPGGGGALPSDPYFSSISTGAVYLENSNAAGNFPFRLRANSASATLENTATGGQGVLAVSTLYTSSIGGGVNIESGASPGQGLNMNNGGIALDSAATEFQSGLYYDAGDSNTYMRGLSTHQVIIGTQANPLAVQVSDTGLYTSSLGVSSINGAAYPPPPTPPTPTPPGYYNWLPEQQTIGSGTLPNILNYSTITPSPVFSTTTGFTLSGSLTCSVTFQGSGNTNPVTNVAQTSNASFGLYMIMDGNKYPLTSLSFTTPNNSSPAGQYNSVAPSYNSNANQGAFIVQPNYNFNSASASPGVEFTYTALGAHTFQLFAWTDLFMASGDPTANYATVLRFPRSGDFSQSGILVQYH